ncbi:MAG: threonine synthase [Treponemataceae bacterium]|nr:MAG: threonine synthase [Treponemataceae bacterium]
MRFISTRANVLAGGAEKTGNPATVSFEQALTDCLPEDGGLYVPASAENLRNWILYTNSSTSFTSIAGALTSALIREEFSPIISEAIAVNAFPFSPEIKRLDDSLFLLELFHGPSGSHIDFGVSYLLSCLEYCLLVQEKHAVVVGVSTGGLASSLAYSLRGKKNIKALVLFPKGAVRGFEESDCIGSGGSLFPVEVDGSLQDCYNIARDLFGDRARVKRYGLTVANTSNIGRLLPYTFLYTYAFSRLKDTVYTDIFYALEAGTFGNLMAGLYAWKFSLPVNGFITNATPELEINAHGKCEIAGTINTERFADIFRANSHMVNALIFPAKVTDAETASAGRELFSKYGVFAEKGAAVAYAATKKVDSGESAKVIIARAHPSFHSDDLTLWCGKTPDKPENLQNLQKSKKTLEKILPNLTNLIDCLEKICENK